MSICHWPLDERPREKLLSRGADALSNAELLAIFLRTGIKGRSAVDLARDLLSDFGSLRSLLQASQQEFCSHAGLGPAKYAQLQAVLTLAKRELQENLKRGDKIDDAQTALALLSRHLRNQAQEVFCCLWLDTRHRVIELQDLFFGSINGAAVYPREVVRAAMKHNAASVILAHNHPSGIAEPSRADEQLTQGLIAALKLVEVRVLDHIVVGDGEHVSFAQRGLL